MQMMRFFRWMIFHAPHLTFDNQKDIKIKKETQAKLFIQSLVKYDTLELVYSSITVKELSDNPFHDYSRSILKFIEAMRHILSAKAIKNPLFP